MTSYLAGTRDGNAKEGEKAGENTNTNTPSPERENLERADKRWAKHRPEKGAEGSANTQPKQGTNGGQVELNEE